MEWLPSLAAASFPTATGAWCGHRLARRRQPLGDRGRLANTQGARAASLRVCGWEAVAACLAGATLRRERLHIAPLILGSGERLLDGVANLKLEQTEVSGTRLVTHVRYRVIR